MAIGGTSNRKSTEITVSFDDLPVKSRSSSKGELGGLSIVRSEPRLGKAREAHPNKGLGRRDLRPVEFGRKETTCYGLKYLAKNETMKPFGKRFDPQTDTGTIRGPFRVVDEKTRGVEPGFIGQKAWTDDDTRHVRTEGHALSRRADVYFLQQINPLGGNFHVQKAASEVLKKIPGAGFDDEQGPKTVFRFLQDHPEHKAAVMSALKGDARFFDGMQTYVMETAAKFTTKHYVKLDYRETEGKGRGEDRTYTIPKSNAKAFKIFGISTGAIGRFFHQLSRRQTPDAINRDAMRESLANDLMKSFGIFAQKLKLVKTQYEPEGGRPIPKLLLDGTHMSGPNGEKFSDFDGAIRGGPLKGQLVKLDPKGEPIVNGRGHFEVDTSIEKMGRNKIFMLLLGDRDAIGSSGGNKGRVGNTFAAIDPGHSLEIGGQNLMARKDIRSDMSFDQPSIFSGRCYKNFTIFDQSPFSERMEGVRELQRLRQGGDDLDVFEEYAGIFDGTDPGMDFSDQIADMKKAYVERRAYILDVFADRLAVYDFDFAGTEGEVETARTNTLDVLDSLEKISSEHSWMSGKTELQYPEVTSRVEWKVAEKDDVLEFRADGCGRAGRERLQSFIDGQLSGQGYVLRRDGDALVLEIPKAQIGKAFGDFGMDNLRRHDAPGF